VGPWLRTGLIDLVTEVAKRKSTRNELIDGREFALDMTTVANVFYACFELKGPIQGSESSLESGNDLYCNDCVVKGWSKIPSDCARCKDLQDRFRGIRDIRLVVDGIFGAKIEGCVYTEAL
jgi:hypothetical protein